MPNLRLIIRMATILGILTVVTYGFAQADARPSLRVALPALPASLDIGGGFSNPDHAVPYSIFDSLIHKDHTSVQPVYIPGLATSWERVSDTVLVLKLREGVRFHNGDAMTAEDVKFSLERFSKADYPLYETPRGIAFGNIERVEVVNPTTVRVVTVKPEPALEAILSMPQAAIIPQAYVEEIGYEAFGRTPVGTGPYRVTEFVLEERVTLAVFENFWGEQPNAGEIIFRSIPELASRITALVNDEVDIVTNVPPDQVATIEGSDCCETRDILSNIFHVLYFNSAHPLMQDKTFRQALSLAIDRQLLVDALWGGQAKVPPGHQFPQFGDIYMPDYPPPAYDPERARELLEASSYEGETITFHTASTYYTNGLLAAQAVTEMWKAIGVNTQLLVDVNTEDFWTEVMVANWSNPLYFTDPAGSYGVMYSPEGFRGSDRWTGRHDEYRALYDRFRYTLDLEERKKLYREVLGYWEDFVPATILYQPIEFYGVRKGVNWQPLPGSQTYILDFRADNLSFERQASR